MAAMFADFGLIFISPADKELRKLSKPLVKELIESSSEISARLTDRSKELQSDGYHVQVNIGEGYFPLFLYDQNNVRRAVRLSGDGFRTNDGSRFTKNDLLGILEETPERFSPSALFRPVVQDFILPTAVYIGGAAEVAYFAQSEVIYRTLQRPLTSIIHRQSYTIVEGRNKRRLSQLEISFDTLFKGSEQMRQHVALNLLNSTAPAAFSRAEDAIQGAFNSLAKDIAEIDTTLLENLARRRRKISRHFAALWKKTRNAQLRNEGVFENRINGVFAELFTNGALQERSLNPGYFFSRCGSDFIKVIYEEIDTAIKDHIVVSL